MFTLRRTQGVSTLTFYRCDKDLNIFGKIIESPVHISLPLPFIKLSRLYHNKFSMKETVTHRPLLFIKSLHSPFPFTLNLPTPAITSGQEDKVDINNT